MASSPKDPKQQKTKPIRRNDVIHCENCGEDYSVTYNRCPFCDERPAKNGRPRTAGGRRVAGGGRSGRPANPLQVAALVGSLVLIIVAMYIVFTSLAPLFSKGEDDPGGSQADPGASTSQTGPDASSTPSGSHFTLQAGESATIQAAVVPADAEITWSSSDESAATVSPEGVVSNVNTGSSQVKVTITATAGDKTAECVVFCRAGGGAGSSSSGTTGTVTGAGSGLFVRSGPGSGNEAIATILEGNTVTILEDMGNGWYRISFIGSGGRATEGYVSKDYIKVS